MTAKGTAQVLPTGTDPSNVCAFCGEPVDEYIDCFESESGRHKSVAAVERFMARLRWRARSEGESR